MAIYMKKLTLIIALASAATLSTKSFASSGKADTTHLDADYSQMRTIPKSLMVEQRLAEIIQIVQQTAPHDMETTSTPCYALIAGEILTKLGKKQLYYYNTYRKVAEASNLTAKQSKFLDENEFYPSHNVDFIKFTKDGKEPASIEINENWQKWFLNRKDVISTLGKDYDKLDRIHLNKVGNKYVCTTE